MDTTIQNDSSIESAIDSIIDVEPEEKEETEGEFDESENEESEDTLDEEAEEDDSEGEDEQEHEDDENTQEPLHTVTVDGKEEQVTLEDLKRGYSGQKYVQQGMEEAAQERKQAQDAFNALAQERQQLGQLFNQFVNGQIMPPPVAPPMEMLQSDPIGYMEQKAYFDQAIGQWNQQMQGIMQQFQPSQAEQGIQKAYAEREAAKLQEIIPELKDEAKAGELKAQVAKAAEHYGFSPQELSAVVDHRTLHVLIDAARYREVVRGRAEADKKAAPAKNRGRPVKSGSKKVGTKMAAAQRQKNRLKQTGRIEDALDLMFNV